MTANRISNTPWRRRAALALVAALLLAACAGSPAYREGKVLVAQGKTAEGLAKLEQAVRDDPANAEYRIALSTQRVSYLNRLLATAEAARREGRLADAEKAYRLAAGMDPENAMARQGIEALVKERRHRRTLEEAEALFKNGGAAALADASEKLRDVLSENPGQKDALNLKSRIDETRSREPRAEMKLAAKFREPISLEFRDAPLKAIIEVIAKASGLNFYYDRDIRPDLKATVFAKNTTIEDTLRIILITNQLEQKILNENSLLIYPSTPQKLKDYQTLSVRTFYLANADVKAVSNTLKTITKTKDLVIDERLGLIIMRDTPEAIRVAERIVALQDLSDPEVMLEVEILEVKRSRLMELGIQWPSQISLTPLQVAGAAGGTAAALTLEALRNLSAATTQATVGSVVISAHRDSQDGNILANPRIRVRNKEKAKVQIGDRVPVITTTSTSTGFVSESVTYVDVGLKLEVEPNIYLDEEVAIKINLEVSNLVREILSKSGTLSYQIGTRGASTVLRLKDGETQILAGLISDEDRSTSVKIPGLGELPIVGRLFGSQKDDVGRSEILLSITPHIVRSIRRPDINAAEFESGTESNIGAQTLRLSTVDPVTSKDAGKGGAAPAISAAAAASAATPVPATSVPLAGETFGRSSLAWQAPAQVRVGEQFSAVVRVDSAQPLGGFAALLGFDTQLLQVVAVQEGDFFKQAGGQASFSERVDPAQGRVFLAAVRQSDGGGVNGSGTLVTVSFKALKAATATRLQLLSAAPEPAAAIPLVASDHVLRILP